MTNEQAKALQPGDEVFWNDPDRGRCSRRMKIKAIRVGDNGATVVITVSDDDIQGCFASELEARPRRNAKPVLMSLTEHPVFGTLDVVIQCDSASVAMDYARGYFNLHPDGTRLVVKYICSDFDSNHTFLVDRA